MKLSRYTVMVPNYPNDDECTLFNTLSRAMAQINRSVYDSIKIGSVDPNRSDVQILRQSGLLVDDDIDESLTLELYEGRRRFQSTQLSLLVSVTNSCNCACTYCFAANKFTGIIPQHMSEEIADSVLYWIDTYIKASRISSMGVCITGGEPLTNVAGVERIAQGVKTISSNNNVHCGIGVGTNGTLLTPSVVDHLVQLGVNDATLNLDGPKHIHDQRRPLRGGERTFDIIMENMVYAADRMTMYCVLYIDKHNADYAEELLDLLASKGLNAKLAGLNLAYVEWTKPLSAHCRDYDMPIAEFATCTIKLTELLRQKGFKTRFYTPIRHCGNGCTLGDNNYYIDNVGGIYKCQAAPGHPDFRIGHVNDSLTLLSIRASQFVARKFYESNPNCSICEYLPMCRGGCPHENYVRHDDLQRGYCLRDYFDIWLPAMIESLSSQS